MPSAHHINDADGVSPASRSFGPSNLRQKIATPCRLFVSGLLLLAGLFKIYEVAWSRRDGFGLNVFGENLYICLAITEIFLALAFLISTKNVWTWVAITSLFFVFSVFNTVYVAVGQQSCECLGPFSISPMAALGLDIAALVALAFCAPAPSIQLILESLAGSINARIAALTFLTTAVLLCCLLTSTGRSFVAAVQQRDIFVGNPPAFVGVLDCKRVYGSSAVVYNRSSSSVAVTGCRKSYANLLEYDSPIIIPPRGSIRIDFKIITRHLPGFGSGRLVLFTNSSHRNVLEIPYFYLSTGATNEKSTTSSNP